MPGNLPKTVVMGNVCIDRTRTVTTTENKAVSVEQESIVPGSPPVYYQRFLGPRQIQSYIIAPHGEDFNGVRERAKDRDPLAIISPSLLRTLVYENTITDGVRSQRCFNTEGSADIGFGTDRPYSFEARQKLKQADLFIFAPLTPDWQPDQAKEALSLLKRDNPPLRVLALQGLTRNIRKNGVVEQQDLEHPEIVQGFDLVFMSDEDTKDATATAEQITDISPTTRTIVTSREGATIFTRKGQLHVPGTVIEQGRISQDVGTGDKFAIATSIARHYGRNIVKAVEYGNLISRQHLLGSRT